MSTDAAGLIELELGLRFASIDGMIKFVLDVAESNMDNSVTAYPMLHNYLL